MSMFFTIETNFLTKEGIFIRIHRALPAAENFPFYAQGLHRVPHHTGIMCTLTWSVTVLQLLWVWCRSPAFSHITWSQEKPHTKTRWQNSTKHCISVTKGHQSKRETLLGWTTKCYIQQLCAWKANSNVLWAQRRWDSSKRDSKKENADGSTVIGMAAAGRRVHLSTSGWLLVRHLHGSKGSRKR